MAFEEMKIEDSDLVGKQISELADVPELSADDLKKRFDSISKDVIIPKFNLLLLGLVAESAAASIGITPPDGVSADANIAAVVAAISAAVKTNTESRHSHENKVTLDGLTSSVIAGYNRIVTLLQGISNVSNQVSADEDTVPTGRAIVDYVTDLGGGDMLKSVYDANGNGVVDDSEKLGGHLPAYYQPVNDSTLDTSSKSVPGAINEVYEMAQNGGKQLIGDEFDPEKENYVEGDLCIKDNVLYKFTAAKTEKGWDASKVVATTVDAELQSLNTKISTYFPVPDYENVVTINSSTYTAPADGWVSAFATRAANGASTSAPMKIIIYINGIRVSEAYSTSGFPAARLSPVPVRAGDNIKFDISGQSGGGAVGYFYPIRSV